MPLIPLYALALVLAAQALKPRRGRAVLLAFLVGAVLHAGGALGLTAKRYYTFSGYPRRTAGSRMRARALVVGALVLALLALAIVRGLREESRDSGSNSVGPNRASST